MPTGAPSPLPDSQRARIRIRRARTAAYLQRFDRVTPRSLPQAATILVQHGYLIAVGEEGYVWTGKVFQVDPPHRRPGARIAAQRTRAANYLRQFDAVTPRPLPPAAIPLVRYGYLRREQGGYVWTGKPFTVEI